MIIRDKELKIPIIQGGMGVGVSMSGLAGNVAKCGGMGTISSVNIGYKDKDFYKYPKETNLRVLGEEISKAKEIAGGNGLIAVNIMCAVSHYEETCRVAVDAGADAIISGAGLPLTLPGIVNGSKTLFAPIISSMRAARLLLRHYKKYYDMKPDFFVIEGSQAGGHLGFSAEDLEEGKTQTNLEILGEVLTVAGDTPVFLGGGIFTHGDMREAMDHGAAGVQLGSRFIATRECDASDRFKKAMVETQKEDIILIKSPVGMPARAINSPLIKKLSRGEKYLARRCNHCLTACPKGDKIPYCISRALINAVEGNWEEGLFFSGSNVDRIHEISTVEALMKELMGQ